MYKILCPIIIRLWAWKKHLKGKEPQWLFWSVPDWEVVLTMTATDKIICHVLFHEFLHD